MWQDCKYASVCVVYVRVLFFSLNHLKEGCRHHDILWHLSLKFIGCLLQNYNTIITVKFNIDKIIFSNIGLFWIPLVGPKNILHGCFPLPGIQLRIMDQIGYVSLNLNQNTAFAFVSVMLTFWENVGHFIECLTVWACLVPQVRFWQTFSVFAPPRRAAMLWWPGIGDQFIWLRWFLLDCPLLTYYI